LRRLPVKKRGLSRTVPSEPFLSPEYHQWTQWASFHRSRLAVPLFLALVMVGGLFIAGVRESQALPGFARKYNADCAMCHFPAIPRLNNFGQQYRRAGYRTPIEFNKDQDMTKVNELLSGRLRAQVAYENNEGSIERSEFRFPEASLYYVGAVSRNFSAYFHAIATNSTNVDFHGHIQGIYGSPEQFFSARIGQMHMLQQEGVGGFDRPTSISINPVHSLALTRTSTLVNGSALNYNFDLRQKGLELAYIRGPGRLLVQVSNGLNQTGSGTANFGDVDPQKDYLVAYEHLLDEIASGFTVFYLLLPRHHPRHGPALGDDRGPFGCRQPIRLRTIRSESQQVGCRIGPGICGTPGRIRQKP